ncbi:MAG TPA: Sua5/YciO/YrdC/YwlC family protein, partial [Spirochaetota bacterium]|nr:Sua5/YciO/YrdC/YwlC family protein [Spirochaetota bacterium]
APSANPQGMAPALDVGQAQEMFEDAVDLYIDGGTSGSDAPSTIVSLVGSPKLVRQGILEVMLEDFV